jgi:DNA-binding Lrp family transcriptional regulator
MVQRTSYHLDITLRIAGFHDSTKTLDDIDKIIIKEIDKDKSISIPQMSEVAKRSARTTERRPTVLQAHGALRRVGSERNGHWEILE